MPLTAVFALVASPEIKFGAADVDRTHKGPRTRYHEDWHAGRRELDPRPFGAPPMAAGPRAHDRRDHASGDGTRV
ncbi:hypothetical protein V1227_16835 [Lentzea sp. DG1S-22]|uniref:hypothetical protein n=1 Tax=Lentzea sp. DG1S-22 TaxID=3108822 RepID=UPI002E7818E4|nr:hypothetical protein [Lentzea sp. DG1S-22]WVH84339.1 hypothetical protein V1227_16835 [Lentzea sp. DG1S-22]